MDGEFDDLHARVEPGPPEPTAAEARRNAALATIASGVAVAAIIVPVALLARGGDEAGPRLIDPDDPSATGVEVVTAIPADFPVDLDQQDFTLDGGEVLGPSADAPGVGYPDLCGASVWTADPVERLASTVTGPDFADGRELRTYASTDEAVAEMGALRTALAECAEEPVQGGTEFHRTFEDNVGYETLTWSETYDASLGGNLYQVVRVGSALLATTAYGEFGPEIDHGTVLARTSLAGRIASAMCPFAPRGCD